jgi:hypothetical protein
MKNGVLVHVLRLNQRCQLYRGYRSKWQRMVKQGLIARWARIVPFPSAEGMVTSTLKLCSSRNTANCSDRKTGLRRKPIVNKEGHPRHARPSVTGMSGRSVGILMRSPETHKPFRHEIGSNAAHEKRRRPGSGIINFLTNQVTTKEIGVLTSTAKGNEACDMAKCAVIPTPLVWWLITSSTMVLLSASESIEYGVLTRLTRQHRSA